MAKKRINKASLYINDSEFTYQIRRSMKAKYLRLQINPLTGLEVVIPRGCKPKEAEEFIYKKKDWILKHLKDIYLFWKKNRNKSEIQSFFYQAQNQPVSEHFAH